MSEPKIKPHTWSIEPLTEDDEGNITGTERPSQPLYTYTDFITFGVALLGEDARQEVEEVLAMTTGVKP